MQESGGLGISLSGVVFYLVNFGVVVFVLARYLYKPLLKFLDDRQESIRRNLREVDELKYKYEREVEGLRARQAEAEAKMEKEVNDIRRKAFADAETMKTQAQAEGRKILEQARRKADSLTQEAEAQAEAELLDRVNKVLTYALHSSMSPDQVVSKLKTAWRESKPARGTQE